MSTLKSFNKEVVLSSAQYEARKAAGTLEEGVVYEINDFVPVDTVKIDGTALTNTDGAVNIPVGNGVLGALKADGYYQLQVDGGGAVNAKSISYANYDSGSANLFVSKGTLENVLDNESVRVDKVTSLTDAQKAQGRNNINATTLVEYTGTETSYAENVLYFTTD